MTHHELPDGTRCKDGKFWRHAHVRPCKCAGAYGYARWQPCPDCAVERPVAEALHLFFAGLAAFSRERERWAEEVNLAAEVRALRAIVVAHEQEIAELNREVGVMLSTIARLARALPNP